MHNNDSQLIQSVGYDNNYTSHRHLHSVNHVFGVQLFSNQIKNKNKLPIHVLFASMRIISH
jgi:hypothetical protein